MASIYALKTRFQDLLRPCVRRLHGLGATANQVTVAAALASLVVAVVAWRWAPATPALYALLPAWMAVRMALNAIDGMLAREFGQRSRLGACINELGDVVADTALYLALLAVPGVPAALPWVFALLAGWTEFAGVLGPAIGAQRRYDGPMGKSDRAVVVGALGLALSLGLVDGHGVAWVLALACALCVATVVNRVRASLAQAREDLSGNNPRSTE